MGHIICNLNESYPKNKRYFNEPDLTLIFSSFYPFAIKEPTKHMGQKQNETRL
jgi:hypothetical protein